MSKDRARRRAARESAALAERARRSRAARRQRWWAAAVTGLARPADRFRAARRASAGSALGRRRTQENITLAGVLLGVNFLVWLIEGSWGWRVSALVLSLMAWPVLAVLIFDRRPSR